jgi:hypothetical protein
MQTQSVDSADYQALSMFTDKLHHDIDSTLIEQLQDKSFIAASTLSIADKLSALTCNEIIHMMESSQLDIKNYLKLFINR